MGVSKPVRDHSYCFLTNASSDSLKSPACLPQGCHVTSIFFPATACQAASLLRWPQPHIGLGEGQQEAVETCLGQGCRRCRHWPGFSSPMPLFPPPRSRPSFKASRYFSATLMPPLSSQTATFPPFSLMAAFQRSLQTEGQSGQGFLVFFARRSRTPG